MEFSKKIVSLFQSDWKSDVPQLNSAVLLESNCLELPPEVRTLKHWPSQCAPFSTLSFVVLHSQTVAHYSYYTDP